MLKNAFTKTLALAVAFGVAACGPNTQETPAADPAIEAPAPTVAPEPSPVVEPFATDTLGVDPVDTLPEAEEVEADTPA